VQFGEIRREIEFLPDKGLQQRGVIGQAIDDLGGGEAIPFDPQFQVGHIRAPWLNGICFRRRVCWREFLDSRENIL
jgi:hypothetical protein